MEDIEFAIGPRGRAKQTIGGKSKHRLSAHHEHILRHSQDPEEIMQVLMGLHSGKPKPKTRVKKGCNCPTHRKKAKDKVEKIGLPKINLPKIPQLTMHHEGIPSTQDLKPDVSALKEWTKTPKGRGVMAGTGALAVGTGAYKTRQDRRKTRALEQIARNTGGRRHSMVAYGSKSQPVEKSESKAREAASVAGSGAMAWGFARSGLLRRAFAQGAARSTGSEKSIYQALLHLQEGLKGPTEPIGRAARAIPPVRGAAKLVPRSIRPGVALGAGSLAATGPLVPQVQGQTVYGV